jgi:tRNA(Arg) A34 adenosine deaminase TadA
MNERDLKFLREAIELARSARRNGNHPFGAVLVDEHGQILMRAENTVVTERDVTGHAEMNLMRSAGSKYDAALLAHCTVYASTEPCPMCAGALFWANVRRVVFGLSEEGLYDIAGWNTEDVLHLPCREVFARGKKPVQVDGPALEDEAREVHLGFWT